MIKKIAILFLLLSCKVHAGENYIQNIECGIYKAIENEAVKRETGSQFDGTIIHTYIIDLRKNNTFIMNEYVTIEVQKIKNQLASTMEGKYTQNKNLITFHDQSLMLYFADTGKPQWDEWCKSDEPSRFVIRNITKNSFEKSKDSLAENETFDEKYAVWLKWIRIDN